MHLALNRLALILALILPALLPDRAGATTPVFLTGASANSADPFYGLSSSFGSVPVGKTLVVPIAVSGSGPMTYSVTSTNPALAPIVKTGYPVMNVHVTYSGTNGPLSTVYAFTGSADGGSPFASVFQSTDDSLYGTTETDGTGGYGTVFQLTTTGTLNTLWSFTGGADGANPYGSLVQGSAGFYGTTEAGGADGQGTVFLVTTSGSLTTLWSFTGGTDGANPYCALVSGTAAAVSGSTSETIAVFLGTTKNGGADGKGSIFAVTTSGSLSTVYSFTGGADGANPEAGLIQGTDSSSSGSLVLPADYGTTVTGGTSNAGTVYKLSANGVFSSLYSFTGGSDGGSPYAGVIQETDGNLYGTTEAGGANGDGTVYRITTSGSLTTLYSFTGGNDGAHPYAPLVGGTDGFLYGATETDGSNGVGTVFQISTSGSLNTLFAFTPASSGGNPYAGLVQGNGNILYGATTTDGSNNHGTVYALPLPNAGSFSGTMKFALLRDMAPTTVGYITGFAQAGYYDGLDFFRITDLDSSESNGFIAQGGDPTETGTGTPGFAFNNEFSPSLIFTGEGQLAMANSGIDSSTFLGTNGSQFFFTQGPIRALDYGYTIFGQLLTGFDVMQQVMSVPLQSDGSSPTVPVVMDSVTVSEDDTDAVLLVSAGGYVSSGTLKVSATDPSGNKAVVASGTSSSPGLAIVLSTPVQDSVNDPPYIVPDPSVTAPLRQKVSLPIRAVDLEFDDFLASATTLASTGPTMAQSGNLAIVTPAPDSPIGTATVGLDVYQPYVSDDRSSPYDETAVNVYLGTGVLTPFPGSFLADPGSPLATSSASLTGTATTFGSFLSSNPGSAADNFTASINWGDGVLASGTAGGVSVVNSSNLPTQYAVSCTNGHIYSNAGIYPIHVTVTGSNGGMVSFQDTAVVSAGPIYPFGRTFTAPAGLANCLVATFVDNSPHVTAGDYQGIINWGDGSVSNGTIRGSNGSYSVYGQHHYTGGTTYPVDVTVQSLVNASESGYAWSTATVSGVPTRQPPFAQSHITGQIGSPGYNGLDLSEEVTLVNSGNIASGPISLKFYLSPTASVQPIAAGAIPLAIGKASSYNTPSIPAGSAIAGAVSNIALPTNIDSRGLYIIMQVITSDPIANHMEYPRAFADPFPLIE